MLEIILSTSLTFPDISPDIVKIGPLTIRWYSMAYLAGWGLAWFYMLQLIKKKGAPCNAAQVGDFFFWAMIGIILGGRLGYVLFYKFSYYLGHPADILALWDGGMSFHGGFLGVAIARMACVSPIGLLLGRVANFINGELFGRTTDAPVGMIFPRGGPLPRHPSQLYEAALEGLALFFLLWFLFNFTQARKKPGLLTGVFLVGYALARTFVEQYREPDNHLGFLYGTGFLTMGQLLSIPMIAVGLYLVFRKYNKAI